MAAKVETQNEISLAGVYYPITRPVQSTLASIYPAKVVIGDTTKDSQIRTSVIAWSDWRGGIGIDRMEESTDINRAWWSDCQLRFKNHLVLGNYAKATASVSHGLSTHGDGAGIAVLQEFDSKMYVVFNSGEGATPRLYVYQDDLDRWWDGRTSGNYVGQHASDTFGVSQQVTDSIIYNKGTTTYFVLAHHDSEDSGYHWAAVGTGISNKAPSYDGTNNAIWTGETSAGQETKYLAVWDDRLWGISNEGQLWYSTNDATSLGTEVLDAKLTLPSGYVTALFVARDSGGEPILYAATQEGLWAHDVLNSRFVKTEVEFPFHPNAGKGTQRWRDSIYFPSGLGVYKYVNGTNQAVLTVVGPDRDDGIKNGYHGHIKQVVGSHNELIVGIDSLAAPEQQSATDISYQWNSNGAGVNVIEPSTGLSSILGYNEIGWEVKWVGDTEGRRLGAMTVSNAYGSDIDEAYRLWWGYNDRVYWQKIPSNIINPSQVTDFEYAATGRHETPWFNAGQSEVDKLALKLKVEVRDASSTETVVVKYALDYSESFTALSPTITSSGITTFTFNDDDGDPAGKKFSAIKFRLELARGTSGVDFLRKTPDVVSMTLEWRKKIEPKWGHQVQVDMSEDHKGRSPKDLRSNLMAAIESETLVEFTFRDDSGGTRNYWVDVVSATGMEYTGYDERGESTITLVEP